MRRAPRTRRRTAGQGAACIALLLGFLTLPASAWSAPGTIATVAGNGTAALTGDGGPATNASLNHPQGVIPAPSGGYYIADNFNHVVRRVDAAGTIHRVAGTGTQGFSGDGGPALDARLNFPRGLAVAPDGSLLIADTNNSRIRKVAPNGVITTVAGGGGGGDGGLATAAGLCFAGDLAVEADGDLLIADTCNNRVRHVSAATGIITTVAGTGAGGFAGDGGPATSAQLQQLQGVALTPDGGYVVADTFNNRIRKVSAAGTITTVAGSGGGGAGGDGGPATAAGLGFPEGVEVTHDGSILIPDTNNHRIRRVTAAGGIETLAGDGNQGFAGDGGSATAARLSEPFAVTEMPGGDLLIADHGNHRIRRVEGTPVPGATFVVNTNADTNDGACTSSPAGCTLREAINAANAEVNASAIEFAIGVGGDQTITVTTPLPVITKPVTIDGRSQPGFVSKPLIELSGNGVGSSGLQVEAPSNIRALVLGGFGSSAISLRAGPSTVQGSYLGTTANGLAAHGNAARGLSMTSADNLIGGTTALDRNVISGNSGQGIVLLDNAGGSLGDRNRIVGNYVGVDAAGTGVIPNGNAGVQVNTGHNTVGGTLPAERNVMSGNNFEGVAIVGGPARGHNVVAGNYIGTSAAGTSGIPNGSEGVAVVNAANTIGPGNVISGNVRDGVQIRSADGDDNRVIGNLVGTNAAGTAAVPNLGVGILVSGGSDNTIGGTLPAERNVVSGNGTPASVSAQGVRIEAAGTGSSNSVVRNYVGLTGNGAGPLGNRHDGIFVRSPDTTVVGNTVADNGEDGIQLLGPGADGNTVQDNRVGTDATGSLDRGNGEAGIEVLGSSDNVIGGASAADRNVVGGNGGDGVLIDGIASPATPASGNQLLGNYIGLRANGANPLENAGNGVLVRSQGNTIGGATPAVRNVISGNGGSGVRVEAGNTTMQGNYVGTDNTGESPVSNNFSGIAITGAGNTVGGTVAGAGNLLSGNRSEGLLIAGAGASDNTVQGNLIGTDDDGFEGIPNGNRGVHLDGPDNTIGGSAAGARNVISANTDDGIFIEDRGSNAVIQGNYFGTNINGQGRLGNGDLGIWLSGAKDVVIGGSGAGERNIIGNSGRGILVEDPDTERVTIAGNWIGIGVGGVDIGNTGIGVQMDPTAVPVSASDAHMIGGTDPGAGNTIAFNGSTGIFVGGNAGPTSQLAVSIRRNSIHTNGSLGIDLAFAAANDNFDADGGPNGGQNKPDLSVATSGGGSTTVRGQLSSKANQTYTVEFFSNLACDPSGSGEGRTYLASATVTTNGAGAAPILEELPDVPVGQLITATATDSLGNTSEFSQCREVLGPPEIRIGDSGTDESAGFGSFTVTLSHASARPVDFHIASADGSAVAPGDYQTAAGDLTILPGDTELVGSVLVNEDALDEPDESFNLDLSSVTNATVADGRGAMTITDNDAAPALSIADVSVTEGTGGATNATFTVTLDAPSGKTVTVDATTANGTALHPDDYDDTDASLTFAPGDTSETFQVPIEPDALDESNESFSVSLANQVNASIADGSATGTITDDDGPPAIAGGDATIGEGAGNALVPVTLSAPSSNTVTVDYATANGTASEPGDYTSATGTVSFAPGETAKNVQVPAVGDSLDEPDETVFVNFSAPQQATLADNQALVTIADDDAAPSVSADDVTVTEGSGGGDTDATFTVALAAQSGKTVKVDVATDDGSAVEPADYDRQSDTLTFAPGQTTKTYTVPVAADETDEPQEQFELALRNPENASVDHGGVGTIDDDDDPPAVSIDDVRVAESTNAEVNAAFTVSLSRASGKPIAVDVQTADGSATADTDYAATSATLSLAPGETSKAFAVIVGGDNADEPDEDFRADLTAPANAVLGDARGDATIVDNDPTPLPPAQQPEQRDGDEPGLTLRGLARRLSRADLLSDGLAFGLTPDEAVSLDVQLIARPRMLTAARTGDVVIARKKLPLADGQRRVKLKVVRKLRRRFTHRRAELRLTILATDAAGNRTRVTRPVVVR